MHTGKRRWQLVLHTFVILTQIAALSGLGYFAASLGNTSVAYAAAAGPGGVTANLALWLRADVGTSTTTNGAAVTTWADQSGLANNATVAGTQANNPTYTTVASNFNPGVLFNGSATKRFNTAAQVISLGNTSYAAFGFADGGGPTVFSEGPQTTNNGIYLRNGVTGGPFPPEPTHDFVNNSYAPAQTVANAPRLLDWRYISASSTRTIGVNGGAELTNSTQTLNMGASVGYIGQDLNAGAIYYAGNIDEVIVYNGNSLTATQIQQIHSYLSLKYGLTLATAQNYLASDGTTITWNATTNAAYNNNITGIARDDASAFNQKQSKNLNAAALVTMSLGTLAASNAANTSTFPTDKSYDVYGDNAGATTLTGSYGGTANNRLARVWKVQETGTVGAVQVYLPTSTNAGLKQIIVSHTDPTFGTVDVQAPLTTSGANYVASVDLANGDYFTFASDTTPPDTTIVTTPANPTNSTSGTFTFTGSDNVTAPASLTFQCSLDGGAYAACTSPKTYTGLAAGNHTFTVRAIDAAGNIDPTPATYTWTIDLTAPVVNLNAAGPINNTNKSAYPVSGTCDPAEGVVTVKVGTVTTTTPCTAGGTFSTTVDASAVPDGASTTITASQTDAAGNTGAAIKTVLKDTVAPVVTVAAPTPINSTNKSAYPVSGTCNTADGNVTVNVGGITKTTACTAGAFSTTVDASTLADGASVPITASQTDTAGNTGTGTNTTSKDTVPPTVGADPLTPINNTNKGAYPVSGTCDPAAGTVTVKVGTATTTTPCTAGGTFSTTIDASAVPDGPAVPVTVSQTDPAGNIGSTSGTVLKDTAAPTATPVITSPASGATTNNTKPTFTGNGAEPGSTVTVKDGTTVVLHGGGRLKW